MSALRLFLWMIVLTGVIYPLIVTGIALTAFKDRSEGDFIQMKDKKAGARLIGQKFTTEKYFWPRPSAVDYQPLPSGGSNLGPTSAVLKKEVETRRSSLAKAHQVEADQIPPELLFASGSGLDPHLTPVAAYFQVARVAKARGLDSEKVKELVASQIEERRWGFLGEPCVNVLLLNQALDSLPK
jgi:potassium-transporting ATPase KdpC subunit